MRVEYVYDVISPYTALALQSLKRYRTEWKFELKLVPVSLGGIMKASGNRPPATVPSKGMQMMGDLERNAKLYGYKIDLPSNFFAVSFKTQCCQRFCIAAEQQGYSLSQQLQLIQSLTDCVLQSKEFRNDSNEVVIGDKKSERTPEFDKLLLAGAKNCGFLQDSDIQELIEVSNSPEVKKILEGNTKDAVDRGVFGCPTFFISDEENGVDEFMVFGSDRFEQIALICGKPYYGATLQLKDSKL